MIEIFQRDKTKKKKKEIMIEIFQRDKTKKKS